MKLMMNYSGQRVMNHVKRGDSLANYWMPIGRIYSSSLTVTHVKNASSNYFSRPNSTIDLLPSFDFLGRRTQPNKFYMKNGNAFSSEVSIFPDYQYCIGVDTAMYPSIDGKNNKIVVTPNFMDPKKSALSFVESWSFDAVSGKFSKQTNFIGFWKKEISPIGEGLGIGPVLGLENPGSTNRKRNDILFRKNVVTDVAMNYSETKMMNDTIANKYSYEDYKYVMEDPFGNVPSEDRTKFFAAILYFAMKNPQNVFPMKENEIDSLHPFKSLQSVYELFHSVDSTIQVEDPMNPGTFFLAPITFETPMSMIYGLRFYEDWYYDSKEMVMKKVVKGIGLLVEEYHWDGTSAIVDKGIYIKVN